MNYFEFFKSHGLKVSSSDGHGLQIQGLSFLQGNKRDFILQYARRHKLGILIELLWAKAWTLAEYIDNPEGDPLADRQARLPELKIMMDRIAEIEQAGTLTPDLEPPTPTGIVTTTTTTAAADPESGARDSVVAGAVAIVDRGVGSETPIVRQVHRLMVRRRPDRRKGRLKADPQVPSPKSRPTACRAFPG